MNCVLEFTPITMFWLLSWGHGYTDKNNFSFLSPVLQDRIYWTDRDKAAVFMANRLTGQDIQALAENLNDPHDIVVFHQLRQPPGVCSVCVRPVAV